MKVVLIEDHTLFAEAIRPVLEAAGMEVAAHATTGAGGLEAVGKTRPDVVLIDLGLPDMPGIAVGRQILDNHPDTRVVAVTGLDEGLTEREVLRAGFHGFVSKNTPLPKFTDSLSSVLQGEVVRLTDHSPHSRITTRVVDEDAALMAGQLTPRELEVLEILVRGGSNSDIAERLSLSPNTVRTHVQSILTKLQVRSRLEAAAFAVRSGLMAADPERRYA